MAAGLVSAVVRAALGQRHGIGPRLGLALYLGGLVAYWLYITGMHSSARQATVGKLALGIKVTDYRGERIGFARANWRFFAWIVSGLTFGVAYVMAGFTKRRQMLHDMMSKTLVVKKRVPPEVVVAGPPARAVPVWAIVPLVLLGMLPQVGLLASIAWPAYQEYTIRAQIHQGLEAATPHKLAVARAAAAGRAWDEIDSAALGLPLEATSPYLQSIEVAGGAIALTFGGQAAHAINPAQLTLVPGLNGQGEVVWICGYASVSDDVEVALEDYQQYTNVPEAYLPSRCRMSASGAVD
jgi:Tfp pilus assembly major pilin PilA